MENGRSEYWDGERFIVPFFKVSTVKKGSVGSTGDTDSYVMLET